MTYSILALALAVGCVSDWTVEDRDGDGYTVVQGDCDDNEAVVHPGATETCDGLDNDCSGDVDDIEAGSNDPGAVELFQDSDHDGYGNALVEERCTSPDLPVGLVTNDHDCDDTNADVRPGQPEVCDGIDNDCDNVIDPADSIDVLEWWPDADQDGFGAMGATSQFQCDAPVDAQDREWADNDDDCDDSDEYAYPGAPEECDDFEDQDCDGDPNNGCE